MKWRFTVRGGRWSLEVVYVLRCCAIVLGYEEECLMSVIFGSSERCFKMKFLVL